MDRGRHRPRGYHRFQGDRWRGYPHASDLCLSANGAICRIWQHRRCGELRLPAAAQSLATVHTMADADHRTGAVALARKVSMRDFSGEVVIQKGKAPRAYGPNLGRSPCWNSGDALYSHRSINHGLRAMFVETFHRALRDPRKSNESSRLGEHAFRRFWRGLSSQKAAGNCRVILWAHPAQAGVSDHADLTTLQQFSLKGVFLRR
jgi:hypothetical protein